MLSDTDFITQLYENVLGRAPDAPGLAGWLTFLQTNDASDPGSGRPMVLVGFAESTENIVKAAAAGWLFQV